MTLNMIFLNIESKETNLRESRPCFPIDIAKLMWFNHNKPLPHHPFPVKALFTLKIAEHLRVIKSINSNVLIGGSSL